MAAVDMLLIVIGAGFGAAFLAHTAPFPFLLDKLGQDRAVWRVPHEEGPPTVYLTYDDGPNPTATPVLLDVLAAERAVATFFLIDRHITEETAPIVRRMFDEGHAVALHSDTRSVLMLSPAEFAAHLTAAADRIERLTGSRPRRLFRPHAGWRSGSMYAGLARIDHRLVGWGWQLWDFNWYRRPEAAATVKRCIREASPGDIIVLHDGHHEDPRADRRHTIEATAKLVPALRKRGFVFGTIGDSS